MDMQPLSPPRGMKPISTAFGCPRDFVGNRFVYLVISPRADGLSVGVNMNPDKFCNFDCVYCEVDRQTPSIVPVLDVEAMLKELEDTLKLVHSGGLAQLSPYSRMPSDLLRLRHVCLSGDGEPTLCPRFAQVVEGLVSLRARGAGPFFKMVLVTNCAGLDLPEVEDGLRLFTPRDEIWAKLEAGTDAYMQRINKADCSIEDLLRKILRLSLRRAVVIQSLFCAVNGEEPPPSEIEAYVERLRYLKESGAQISLVQIYSATRPTAHAQCKHLPLSKLSIIARRVREGTGLPAEVF